MAKSFLSFLDSCHRASAGGSACWVPAADVYRAQDTWLIKFDLAGINPRDIRLECRGHCLILSGVRRDALVTENFRSYALEISYNRFERSLELPCNLDTARITTEYRDGMLLVTLECSGEPST
jgi:HSP20 family protein